jgi:hypothetical protein
MLNTSVISANKTSGAVTDITTNNGIKVIANQFIDCSAQDILLSLTGAELLCGGDAKDRYYAEYGFTEEHAPLVNYDWCNSPTLLYRIGKGAENISDVEAKYNDFSAFTFYNANSSKIYINSFNFIDSDAGNKLITDGIDSVYHSQSMEMIHHWATIKAGSLKTAIPTIIGGYKFDMVAPMLGVREYYRAKCERMLHEGNLYTTITNDNIKSAPDNLDKVIAVGNAGVDVYGDPYLDSATTHAMNSLVRPYGVPYGCIIPKNYTNVLVASKGAGMTHIGEASFRLTKQMMQLGWAAGHATRILNENELTDYRNVNVETLQSASYADIVGMVADVVSLL